MDDQINVAAFIEGYSKLAEKFEAIRRLPYSKLFSMDSIEIDGENIIFRCSDSFRGSMDYENYTYTSEEINKPIAYFEKQFSDYYNKTAERALFEKKRIEATNKHNRKLQYEQLKKEFNR